MILNALSFIMSVSMDTIQACGLRSGLFRSTNQLEEIFPKVLSHEPEEREEGPAERVVAGVPVVWVPPRPHTHKALWTNAAEGTHALLLLPLCCRREYYCSSVLSAYPASELFPHRSASRSFVLRKYWFAKTIKILHMCSF